MALVTKNNFFQVFKEMAATTIGIRFLMWTVLLWAPALLFFVELKLIAQFGRWLLNKWNPSVIEVLVVMAVILMVIILIGGIRL